MRKRIILLCSIACFFVGLIATPLFAQNSTPTPVAPTSSNVTTGTAVTLDGKPFAHQTADVNGVRLHYVQGGSGTPVVLLHGYPETWYAWRKVMPALADRYTVVAPDMRGLGESSRPTQGYDKKTVAARHPSTG